MSNEPKRCNRRSERLDRQQAQAPANQKRRAYRKPELKRLGTVEQLTKAAPGTAKIDNDPYSPGSTF